MFKKVLPKSKYARNVLTLMIGTSLAQSIPVAISPILTRLYSPDEFGRFAIYMAIVMIASVFVTGRYELAILQPRKDRDALYITVLAVLLSIVISGLLFLIVILFDHSIANILGDPGIAPWLYWIPASTMLVGAYQSLNYWSNRNSQYKRLAISRTVNGASVALSQMAGGYANIGATGLVGGQIVGQALSVGVLARMIWREDGEQIRTFRVMRSIALAKRYVNFPKYLIVGHSLNTASGQVPVLLLSALFSTTIAGFFTLTQRVMSAPMSLVAGALADVFRQEASYAYIHKGSCEEIYKKTFKLLVSISLPPFLILFFIAPDLFVFIFGEQWRSSGEYAQLLTPMIFLQFVVSPLSSMFMIAEQQRLDFLWQIFLLTSILSGFFAGWWLGDEKLAVMLFSLGYCIAYIVCGAVCYMFSKGWNRKMS